MGLPVKSIRVSSQRSRRGAITTRVDRSPSVAYVSSPVFIVELALLKNGVGAQACATSRVA